MEDYVQNAIRTESDDYSAIIRRASDNIRGLHAAMGVATESGELVDSFKRAVFYGVELDKTNIVEEVGDIFWYIALLADEFEFSIQDCMNANIAKLQARYPERFSENCAVSRNLELERSVLEGV